MIFALLGLLLVSLLFGREPMAPPYISQDQRIDLLLEAHRANNRQQRGMQGFRIQIYTDSGNRSKLRTDRAKAEFDERFPGLRSYISYDEPNYKIRIGDFRSRIDAMKILQRISSQYPGAFIVVDRINFPVLREQDLIISPEE